MSTAEPVGAKVSKPRLKSADLETELQEADREVEELRKKLADLERAERIADDAVELEALEPEIKAACDAFDQAVTSKWARVWGEIVEIFTESEQIRASLQEARELGSQAASNPPELRSLTVPRTLEREIPHHTFGSPLDGPAHLRRVLVRGQAGVGGVDAHWAKRNGLMSW